MKECRNWKHDLHGSKPLSPSRGNEIVENCLLPFQNPHSFILYTCV